MSDKAFRIIQEKRLTPWKGEEEVRYSWMMAIEAVTGLSLNAERGRKDSSLNHVIIEFKAPGLFKGKKIVLHLKMQQKSAYYHIFNVNL